MHLGVGDVVVCWNYMVLWAEVVSESTRDCESRVEAVSQELLEGWREAGSFICQKGRTGKRVTIKLCSIVISAVGEFQDTLRGRF